MLRLLANLLTPSLGRVLARLPVDDPWERIPVALAPRAFGAGSVREFRWYFEGESAVRTACVADVCDWLCGCAYVSDPELFQQPDFWQHPRTFEQLRRGDCEDHALWAWRKLCELGIDAELVAGRWDVTRPDAGDHAWVLYHDAGEAWVLDAVARDRLTMASPLAEVRGRYRPHVAVNARFETTAFAGYSLSLRERRGAGPSARPARARPSAG